MLAEKAWSRYMATPSNCLIRAAEPSEQMGSWYWSWSLTKQIDGQGGSFLFQEWYINVCMQKQFPKQDPPIHPQTSDRWPHVLLPYYPSESHLSASACRRHWQLRRFVYNWCGGRMLQVDHNRTPDTLLPMATPKRARCRAAHCTVKDILKGNPPLHIAMKWQGKLCFVALPLECIQDMSQE